MGKDRHTNFWNYLLAFGMVLGTFVYDDHKQIVFGLDVTDGTRDEDIGLSTTAPCG